MTAVADKNIVVVGAGVAGLTAADRLSAQGASVTVVEREIAAGGLARSFRYGDSTFDIGPHRFHTDDQSVESYVLDVLDGEHILVDRRSAVWLFGNYHECPLTQASLFKLPPLVMARAAADLFRRPKARDESLEGYIQSRYGKTLYDVFFRPYTEKFLSYQCSELHRDWASAGIDRAVIDKRIRFDSLFHVAKSTLLPSKVRTRFIYPSKDGIDRFCEAQVRKIESRGGQVVTSCPVTGLELDEGTIRTVRSEDGQAFEADMVVWTAPLPRLLELVGHEAPTGLGYLDELLFNIILNHKATLPYQWTYYGGAALSFMRASVPSSFNLRNAPPGSSGVCVEVVCKAGDELWTRADDRARDIEHDLRRVGLAQGRDAVTGVHVERVREAYPIYTLDYPERLAEALGNLGNLGNLALLGRSATFWYNNMDDSIRQAIDLAAALEKGQEPRQWNDGLRSRRLF